MENGTREVVEGTHLADTAGQRLAAINDVVGQLGSLIDEITHAAQQQAADLGRRPRDDGGDLPDHAPHDRGHAPGGRVRGLPGPHGRAAPGVGGGLPPGDFGRGTAREQRGVIPHLPDARRS